MTFKTNLSDECECWWEQTRPRVFIHIPKTGGHSIRAVMGGIHLVHWSAAIIRDHLGAERYNLCLSFSVVRNTWDRLVSLYEQLRRGNTQISFEEFILDGENQFWTISQLYFLCDGPTSLDSTRFLTKTSWAPQDQYGEIIVDNILKFEVLEEDIKKIGYNKIGKLNTTEHEHYSTYYSTRLQNIVRDRYRDEIERFGFVFERKIMRVAFGDLKIGQTAQKNLRTVMDTNWASEGPMVRDFEKNWNDLFGYSQSVSMSSGTDACINACLVLYDRGVKRGDEIICPALTFVATVNAIVLAGFTPRFVDIDRNTLNIDPQKIEDALTDKTVGIMVTHTMGKPCDMDAIMSIANERNLFVMEDSCLVPGQNIVTELGIKKIEDIQIGDKVYTHTGQFCEVLNTMNRNYDGDIMDIYTYGQNTHLQVTPEHQIFAVKTENILNNKSKKWIAAADIKEGDYLVLPRYSNVNDVDQYDLSCYDHRSKNARYQSLFESRYKEKISVNSDLMVVIGWYLAEGWCYRQHVEFSLCKDEVENIENLCCSIESLDFEYEIQDRINSKCVNICIFSKQFKSFLKNNFGTGAKAKKIPTWVLDLSLSKIETLLDAYVKGDGNKVKDRQEQYSVTSISLDLLESIRLICSKLGYYAGITQSASAGIGEICGRKVNVSDKYQLRFSKQRLNKIDRRTCLDDRYVYYRVKSIETKKYVGQVFNLEVDKDNSYCGIGWAMHNCEAHGAKTNDKYIGQFGHVAMFSFYTAHIVVAGEGGMCSTMHPEVADILRSTRSHGRTPGSAYFEFLRIGLNSKMNDLEAAVGLEGLEQFNQTIEKRVANRSALMDLLEDLQDDLWLPNLGTSSEFVSPHAFPIVLRQNNSEKCTQLYNFLEQNSIQCKTLFGSMPTQHKVFEYLGYKIGDFPEAEFVGNNGLHFGIHQYLTADDMTYISDNIHRFFGMG